MKAIKNRKILIGLVEIANLIEDMAACLSDSGWSVTTVVIQRNRYYPNSRYNYDLYRRTSNLPRFIRYMVRRVLTALFFIFKIRKYDVFIYVSQSLTYLPFGIDLFILKFLNKDAVIFHVGDDVRYRPIQNDIDKEVFGIDRYGHIFEKYVHNLKSNSVFLNKFLSQKIAEMSGAKVLTIRNQATFQSQPAFLIKLPTIRLLDRPRIPISTPLLIHAPTDRIFKRTDIVLTAVDILRSKGRRFEFELIENKSNQYVLERLKEADILIDQPGTCISKLSAEGLSASCVVLGGNNFRYEGFCKGSPVVQFESNAEELANKLDWLIEDVEARKNLMYQSFHYWENHYSPEAFCRYFESVLSGRSEVLLPLENHKNYIIRFARNRFQKFILQLFYR